jgi:membrane protein
MAMGPSILDNARRLALTVYSEIFRTRIFTVAAALAFFFLLAFIPLLIVLASLLAYLPLPNLFGQLLVMLSAFVPPDSMKLVMRVTNSLLRPGKGAYIGFGLAGAVWAASGGFSATIDALNIAYDAADSRPWWRDRVQSLLLTVTVGGLAVTALLSIILGPEFGHVLTRFFGVSWTATRFWPALRILIMFSSFVGAIMLLYSLAPTVKQRFSATLPGAVLAVVVFSLGSFGLSFYIFHFSGYAKGYGGLGAALALMLWLYIVSIAILLGAEINGELLKMRGVYLVGQRHLPPGPLMPTVAISMPAFARACALEAQQTHEQHAAAARNPVAEDLIAKDGLDAGG